MEYKLINNVEEKQFEFHIEGLVAKVEYILTKDKIFLTHTEVPKQLEGRGIGKSLVKKVLDTVATMNVTLVPLCPFVALFIKKNPEYQKLVFYKIKIE